MSHTIESLYQVFLKNPDVTTDSRQVRPGSVFFALKGDSFNGNTFAPDALKAGASAAVVDDPAAGGDPRCFLVTDVLSTLQALALHHRQQLRLPVLAITGTNGKTTTKELIHAVLSEKYRTVSTRGNLNNHIGVPLTILGIRHDAEIAVIEMGANHPGEIDLLCRIALPGYGLITNIGRAHLEGFGGFEGVVKTKTELYRFLGRHGGKVFLHSGDPLLEEHAKGLEVIRYGAGDSGIIPAEISADPYVGMILKLPGGGTLQIGSHLYGLYNAPNMMAAACVGIHFGVPPEQIKTALESYQPANNRSQIRDTGRNLLVMDAYNANPSSMRAALETFAATSYPSKAVILGDMLELGEESDREHLGILDLVNELAFGEVYLVGPSFTRLNTRRENLCFQDSDLARLWFAHHRPEQMTILIKGSRGIRLEKLEEEL